MMPEELVAEYERTHYSGDPRPGFEGEEHSLLALARRVWSTAIVFRRTRCGYRKGSPSEGVEMTRTLLCGFMPANPESHPALPTGEARGLAPWASRWQIDERRRVYVRARVPDAEPAIVDARLWIETLHDAQKWPIGTVFELVVTDDASGQ